MAFAASRMAYTFLTSALTIEILHTLWEIYARAFLEILTPRSLNISSISASVVAGLVYKYAKSRLYILNQHWPTFKPFITAWVFAR